MNFLHASMWGKVFRENHLYQGLIVACENLKQCISISTEVKNPKLYRQGAAPPTMEERNKELNGHLSSLK